MIKCRSKRPMVDGFGLQSLCYTQTLREWLSPSIFDSPISDHSQHFLLINEPGLR